MILSSLSSSLCWYLKLNPWCWVLVRVVQSRIVKGVSAKISWEIWNILLFSFLWIKIIIKIIKKTVLFAVKLSNNFVDSPLIGDLMGGLLLYLYDDWWYQINFMVPFIPSLHFSSVEKIKIFKCSSVSL